MSRSKLHMCQGRAPQVKGRVGTKSLQWMSVWCVWVNQSHQEEKEGVYTLFSLLR